MANRAWVAFGSNRSDRIRHALWARQALDAHPDVAVVRSSPWYLTAPVGEGYSEIFLNGVWEISTTLAPVALLLVLREMEAEYGRDRSEADRSIDLDLILYEAEGRLLKSDSPELRLPHPRFAQREFVLRPLCAIEPLLVDPASGQQMIELLRKLK